LWPRRKALADGGGSGSKFWGGVFDFFGGEELREAQGLGFDSGCSTWEVNTRNQEWVAAGSWKDRQLGILPSPAAKQDP
jgi:hypothetical protein